jgi:phospholipid/cholesterol/gamma-HCH transport system substrate-binding protein
MKRSVFETILGAIVIIIAASFLVMAYKKGGVSTVAQGYDVTANFSKVDGLQVGADVRIAGVKVGDLTAIELDPKTYQASAHLLIDNNIQIPDDTVALITTEGLLGGKYISLEVGGSDVNLKPGGRMQYTQASANLEELLGQAIFSKNSGSAPATGETPAAAPAPAASPAEPAHP